MKLYPYSKRWFEAQSEEKLFAMFTNYKPKKVEPRCVGSNTKVIAGEHYILTDSGKWERMYD